jgi:16S rRNA (guanine527-N7)-methyltransferase
MQEKQFAWLNTYISVSRETFERFSVYHDLLLKWQSKINLISNDTIADIWQRHFLDSLQLLPYIENKNKVIVDLGSGAGFPAMVLAVAGYQNVHLVESDKRKAAFLREVARVTDAKVSIHNCRIEEIELPKVDIFTSRACAPLDKLLNLIANKVPRETICLFHKGKNYSIEHDEASLNWQYDMMATPSIADSQGVIMKISNLQKKVK